MLSLRSYVNPPMIVNINTLQCTFTLSDAFRKRDRLTNGGVETGQCVFTYDDVRIFESAFHNLCPGGGGKLPI